MSFSDKIKLNASCAFSPYSEHMILAQHGEMSEDFTTQSKLILYKLGMNSYTIENEQTVPTSLLKPVFDENENIAISAENGQICFTNAQNDSQNIVKACDTEITALQYSDKLAPQLLAIGAENGEILFFQGQKLLYSTKTSAGQNPHSGSVVSINWNTRVPRICVTGDEKGQIIVWDQKKKAAIGTVNLGVKIAFCAFSQIIATLVIAVCENGMISLWDMRKGQQHQDFKLNCQGKIQNVEFIEGYEDKLAIRYETGMQEIFEIKDDKAAFVGQSNSKITSCSLFYPNIAYFNYNGEVQLKFIAQHCQQLKPVIYNPIILSGLPDDAPETFEFEAFSLIQENENQIIYVKNCKGLTKNDFIKDVSEVVETGKKCVAGEIEIGEQAKYFLEECKKSSDEVIGQYLLPISAQEKITLDDQEKKKAEPITTENNDDFFDQEEKPAEEKTQQPASETVEPNANEKDVMNCIYNGDIESAINLLIKKQEYAAAIILAFKFNFNCQNVINEVQKQEKSFSKLFQTVDRICSRNINIDQFSNENWQEALRLIKVFDPAKLPLFVSKLLTDDKIQFTVNQKIDFSIYTNNKQQAIDFVQKEEKMSLQQEMQFCSLCKQQNISFGSQNLQKFVEIIQILNNQGENEIANKLSVSLGISGGVQNQVQQQQRRTSNQFNFDQPAQVQQPQQPMTYKPSIPATENNFFTPAVQQPNQQQQDFAPQAPQKRQPKARTDFFSFAPPPAADQKQEVVMAVDLAQQGQQNQQQAPAIMPQPPTFAAPSPPVFAQQQTNQFSAPQQSVFTPQQQVFQPQQQLFQPQSQPQPLAPRSPAKQGLTISAPPPPNMNGEVTDRNPIQVKTTTAPPSLAKDTPSQQVDKTLNGLMAIEQIQSLGQVNCQNFLQILKEYQALDQMGFNKHWAKLGDCACWLAEPQLLSQCVNDTLSQFIAFLQQKQGVQAQKVISTLMREHPKEFDDQVSRWNGAFRSLCQAFK